MPLQNEHIHQIKRILIPVRAYPLETLGQLEVLNYYFCPTVNNKNSLKAAVSYIIQKALYSLLIDSSAEFVRAEIILTYVIIIIAFLMAMDNMTIINSLLTKQGKAKPCSLCLLFK